MFEYDRLEICMDIDNPTTTLFVSIYLVFYDPIRPTFLATGGAGGGGGGARVTHALDNRGTK